MRRNLRSDQERLWRSLMEMAEVGATPKGGSKRLTLTDEDRDGRNLFVRWCENAGLAVTVDAIGNIFARRAGRDPSRPPVMAGSHLDTQPTGGRFDGVLGVLAALEVVRSLDDYGIETEAPVEVAVWTNEEGSRFSPAMMGSGVFAGVFELDDITQTADVDGAVMGEELERIGYAGEAPVGDREVGAYFELHIEQGPILEDEDRTIGVVTAAQGQRWLEIHVTGHESHAGPTPMPVRKDALVVASGIVGEVNRIGHAYAPHACATVGFMDVSPNSRNVIPGHVFLTVDFRHPVGDDLTAMDSDLKAYCADQAEETGVDIAVKDFWHFPSTPFDADCVEAVRAAAEAQGFAHRDIVSGAGHDAVYMARIAPTGMIFVPCEGGISHNEEENATPEDCAAGCDVLLAAVLEKAGVVENP